MAVDWGAVVVGAAGFGLAAILGRPTWRLARRSEKAAEQADLAEAVAQYLGVPQRNGDKSIAPPSKDSPSVLDLLIEIRDYQEEQSILSLIVAYHLADEHGAQIPAWVLANEARRRNQQRERDR